MELTNLSVKISIQLTQAQAALNDLHKQQQQVVKDAEAGGQAMDALAEKTGRAATSAGASVEKLAAQVEALKVKLAEAMGEAGVKKITLEVSGTEGVQAATTKTRELSEAEKQEAAAKQLQQREIKAQEQVVSRFNKTLDQTIARFRQLQGDRLATLRVRFQGVGEGELARLAGAEDAISALKRRNAAIKDLSASALNGVGNVAAALTLGSVAALKFAGDFDSSLERVRNNTLMTNADFANMRDEVQKLAVQSGQSFDDLGNAYKRAANFGFQMADANKVVSAANMSAVATGAKTQEVTNALAGSMHNYKMSADLALPVMNALHIASARGNMDLGEFTDAAGPAIATAREYGESLPSVISALSAMTQHQIPVNEAVTQYKGIIKAIVNPTQQAEGAIKRLSKVSGIDLAGDFSIAGLKSKGLIGILNDLNRATDGHAELVIKKLVPAQRGGLGMLALSTLAYKDFTGTLDVTNQAMAGKLDPTTEGYNRRIHNLDVQMDKLVNRIKVDLIPVGERLAGDIEKMLPTIDAWIDRLGKVFDWFTKLPSPIQGVVLGLGALRIASLALGSPWGTLLSLGGKIVGLFKDIRTAALGAAAAEDVEATAGKGALAGKIAGLGGRLSALGGGALDFLLGGSALGTASTVLGVGAGGAALAYGINKELQGAIQKGNEDAWKRATAGNASIAAKRAEIANFEATSAGYNTPEGLAYRKSHLAQLNAELKALEGQAHASSGALAGVNKTLAERVQALISAAKAHGGLSITSGYRDSAHQAELYRRWLAGDRSIHMPALPGTSPHERGLAVDLSGPALGWAQANAGKFGLTFPFPGKDPVHVQMAGGPADPNAPLSARARAAQAAVEGGGKSKLTDAQKEAAKNAEETAKAHIRAAMAAKGYDAAIQNFAASLWKLTPAHRAAQVAAKLHQEEVNKLAKELTHQQDAYHAELSEANNKIRTARGIEPTDAEKIATKYDRLTASQRAYLLNQQQVAKASEKERDQLHDVNEAIAEARLGYEGATAKTDVHRLAIEKLHQSYGTLAPSVRKALDTLATWNQQNLFQALTQKYSDALRLMQMTKDQRAAVSDVGGLKAWDQLTPDMQAGIVTLKQQADAAQTADEKITHLKEAVKSYFEELAASSASAKAATLGDSMGAKWQQFLANRKDIRDAIASGVVSEEGAKAPFIQNLIDQADSSKITQGAAALKNFTAAAKEAIAALQARIGGNANTAEAKFADLLSHNQDLAARFADDPKAKADAFVLIKQEFDLTPQAEAAEKYRQKLAEIVKELLILRARTPAQRLGAESLEVDADGKLRQPYNQQQLNQMANANQKLEVIRSFADGTRQIVSNLFENLMSGGRGFFSNMEKGFAAMFQQIASSYLTNIAMQGLSGLFGGASGNAGLGGLFGSITGVTGADINVGGGSILGASADTWGLAGQGGFAGGGDFVANKWMTVGEKGPEVILPRTSGTVLNRSMLSEMGGAGDLHIHGGMHFHGVQDAAGLRKSAAQVLQDVHRQAERTRRRNG